MGPAATSTPPGATPPPRARPAAGATPASAAERLHAEEELGKAYDLALMRRLWPYVRRHRRHVAITLALVAPLFVLDVAPAWLVKTGIDRVMAPGGEAARGPAFLERLLAPPAGLGSLAWLSILYGAAVLLSKALAYVQLVLTATTGQRVAVELRRGVFHHVMALDSGFFERVPVGRLVTRATNDVENVAEMFSAGIVLLVSDLAMMVGFAAILFAVDHELALVTFSVVPVLAVAAVVFRLRIREAFRKVRVRIARINTHLQETITGMRIVQLFTRERRNLAEFAAINAEHRDAWHQSIRYDAALFASVEAAGTVTIALIIGWGSGSAGLEAGTLYLFIDLMRRFFLPLRDLSAKYSVMQSAMASLERIFQLLDTAPVVADRPPSASAAAPAPDTRPPAGDRARGEVVFDHVTFGYRPGEPVLTDLSFRVAPGERVALVGPTGTGKTTIIKLLARFRDPSAGRVLLDGVDLRELPQRRLRRRIAVVLQDVHLFGGTVHDNIALGRPDLDRAAVEEAARAVEADAFIRTLPGGYDTRLEEGASNLSTGQRQLISFARALAHGADVLVLDEATSSIDTETEAAIQRGIHTLMAGKTALVIAHRLSTIRDVDRIFVLRRGQIVEAGNHDELIALGGLYRRLYELQQARSEAA